MPPSALPLPPSPCCQVGGLADIKATRIQAILSTLAEEQGGAISLEHLRQLAPAEVKEQLGRFKGVGNKTVACVLLFALEVSQGGWQQGSGLRAAVKRAHNG